MNGIPYSSPILRISEKVVVYTAWSIVKVGQTRR
jgi:hypothetical protein